MGIYKNGKLESFDLPDEFLARNPQWQDHKTNMKSSREAWNKYNAEVSQRHQKATTASMEIEAADLEIKKLLKPDLQKRLQAEIQTNIDLNSQVVALTKQVADLKAGQTDVTALHRKYASVIESGEIAGREAMAASLLASDVDANSAIDILKAAHRETDNTLETMQAQAIANLASSAPQVAADVVDGVEGSQASENHNSAVASAKAFGAAMKNNNNRSGVMNI